MSMFGDKSDTMSLSDAIKCSANQMLFRTLQKNPEQRAKVLQFLTQEGIVDENSSPNKYSSPIKRLQKNNSLLNNTPKSKNTLRLESPSALARKRALQRLESSSSDEPSQKLPSPPFVGTPKPYDQILKGVVAYCEIRSNGEDRSPAIKTIIRSMGAIVKDNLCRGVTHVILKDGLYSTYRKANLLKMHVVSVLWLEAVRIHKFKVPEGKFPAVCADAYDANLTGLCQNMQKDYEEVIQDELNKTKEFDNRRKSEVSLNNFVTERKKWRSTMHGSNFKDPHNRTEIASPYKHINTNPELSESDSYVSVGSDIVPSSQPVAKVLFPDPEPDEILPESNLVNAKNSFELEKASKIRSPESILKETCKKSLKKISVDKEDSLKLHVTTTDESNINSTGKTRNSSSRNLLEDSINKKSSSDELHLQISEDSTNISKEIQNNKVPTISRSNSYVSTLSSDSEISKNKTRRRTVGLKRPKKSSTESLVTPKRKTNSVETTSSEDINKPRNVKKNNRRQTLFKITSPIKENESNVRKTRRKTLADLQNITDENIIEESDKNTSGINISSTRKTRGKTTTKPEDKLEEELKKIFGENEDVVENTEELSEKSEPQNISKKTRRKTIATPKKLPDIDEKIRKSNRKTKNSEETSSNSCENTPNNKIPIRKSPRKTLPPKTSEIQPKTASVEKSKPRVRRLFDPNQQVSLSQIICDSEQIPEITSPVNVSPPKKVKYKVPLVNLPILLSEKAKKKTRSTVKAVKTAKSVPPKITTQETRKRKSAKALTFSNSSSETDLENKKINTPIRKSERIAKTPKKIKFPSSTDLDTLSSDTSKTPTSPKKSQTSLKSKLSQIDEPKRRSTLDFVPQRSKKSLDESRLTQKQKLPIKLPTIVCTRFHKTDVQVFQQIVKKLGRFIVEDEVTKRTTHLVAGGPARTINLLRAIARGCWIVRQEWLYKSLEAGKWLEEEDYEMVEFSPAVQKCRVEKHSFGPLFSMDLFKSCGPVFVSRGSSPRFSDLEELIEICQGRVVRFAKDAKIIVGEQVDQEDVTCVSEKWILDSITQNKMKKLKHYVLHTRSSPVL